MEPKFIVGQKVKDKDLCMGDTWHAKVVEMRPLKNTEITDEHDGWYYITHGRWSDEPKSAISERPLYSEHLESDE